MAATPGTGDPAEARYGFGTTQPVDVVLKRLETQAGQYEALLVINIATLLRNAIDSKSVKTAEAIKKVKQMLPEIAEEFSNICKTKWPNRHHHIIYYLTRPEEGIPTDYLRPRTSPSASLFHTGVAALLKQLKPSDSSDGNVHAHVRLAPYMKTPSYKGIKEAIDGVASSGAQIHLISHMPLDYHITLGTNRLGWLYRSHTGEMVKLSPSALGPVVFNNDNVPFYPVTQVLLGDKHLIRGTLDRTHKAQLLEIAAKDHWALRTNNYVSLKVKENNFLLPYSLD